MFAAFTNGSSLKWPSRTTGWVQPVGSSGLRPMARHKMARASAAKCFREGVVDPDEAVLDEKFDVLRAQRGRAG